MGVEVSRPEMMEVVAGCDIAAEAVGGQRGAAPFVCQGCVGESVR